MTLRIEELERLYAENDDPWNFRTSQYESQKFAATRAATGYRHFSNVLELGCSNGELASFLAPQATNYLGVDAICKPLIMARLKVPKARFEQMNLPSMPSSAKPFDLIVLSEILYFLTVNEIQEQAKLCIAHSPKAEYLLVNFLGETERELQGKDALELFKSCFAVSHKHQVVDKNEHYRIDRLRPAIKLKSLR